MDDWMEREGEHEHESRSGSGSTSPARRESLIPFTTAKDRCVEQFEREYLERLMGEAHGNVSLAARLARMDRKYLRILLKRHELWIPRRSFRAKAAAAALESTEA